MPHILFLFLPSSFSLLIIWYLRSLILGLTHPEQNVKICVLLPTLPTGWPLSHCWALSCLQSTPELDGIYSLIKRKQRKGGLWGCFFYCGKNTSHRIYSLNKFLSAQYSLVYSRHIFSWMNSSVFFFVFFYNSHLIGVRWYIILVLIFISLVVSQLHSFYIAWLLFVISSLRKYLFKYFTPF